MSRFSADKNNVAVTYVEADGSARTVAVPVAANLMRIAKVNGVDMWARCSAGLRCATCHVKLDSAFVAAFGVATAAERALLAAAADRDDRSRLACQLHARPEHDGLTLRVMMPRPKPDRGGRDPAG